MLRHFTAVIAIAMLAASPSALAQGPATAPQSEAKVKKVCKSEAIVGTRFAKKICHTPSEWEAFCKSSSRSERSTGE
ncbi:MAG: hypothetical protein ABI478_11550, partial [Propionivibrio sp.]